MNLYIMLNNVKIMLTSVGPVRIVVLCCIFVSLTGWLTMIFEIQFLTETRQNGLTAARFTKLKTMKKFFAPDTATSSPTTAVPTSEKLVALKAERKTLWAEMLKHEDPDTQEAKDANLAVWKKDGEIKAEMAAISKAENDAKILEARNERLKLAQNLIDAVIARHTAAKNTPADKLAELDGVIATAREIVENELLAKFAGSKPAKVVTSDDGTVKTSGGENKEAILALARSGSNHKDIEAAGYKRSTVWHTINNAKKAGETFPNA